MARGIKKFFLLSVILLIAGFFRFNNLNWDENFHLHPDERFLTMVGNAMTLPKNIIEYFDPSASKVNPANIGYNFFVYGNLPVVMNKYLAEFLNKDNYNDFTILGRNLSAFFDLVIVILVFKTVELLEKKHRLNSRLKYWTAFFYAIAVYPIQSSHFFTVDTFLNFFMFGSFYFALRPPKDLKNVSFSAVFFGLALACKVSAVFILPLILVALFLQKNRLSHLVLFALISYIALRFANPYYFQNAVFFDPRLSENFLSSVKQLKSFEGTAVWYPPAIQWINKPAILFSLFNVAVVGPGLSYFILTGLGMANILMKKKINILFVIALWIFGFFLYQSTQFVKSIRYFIFIYPFLAIFAAVGIEKIIFELNRKIKNRFIINAAYFVLYISLIIWPVLFSTIYFYKNTRVEASEWIYKNLPNDSYILSEYWDDALPLPVLNNYGKQFEGEQLPVFDQETPEKWEQMNKALSRADYYILSSNRGWGSITLAPDKYPRMSKFYRDLLNGKNPQYKKIKEFRPFYYRFLQLPGAWLEEAFTVYDHPEVLIFAREK